MHINDNNFQFHYRGLDIIKAFLKRVVSPWAARLVLHHVQVMKIIYSSIFIGHFSLHSFIIFFIRRIFLKRFVIPSELKS